MAVWFSRIATLAITLLGVVLVYAGLPYKDGGHVLLGVVGLCFIAGGGIFVRGDILNILAARKKS